MHGSKDELILSFSVCYSVSHSDIHMKIEMEFTAAKHVPSKKGG